MYQQGIIDILIMIVGLVIILVLVGFYRFRPPQQTQSVQVEQRSGFEPQYNYNN